MISVAIPAYKAQYLSQAIESVLNQTYKDFELIIVNDASPENIKDLINKYEDTRIKYYENPLNLGKTSVVKNWNKCLEKALGEYFIIFSDDDYMETNHLEVLIKLAQKYPQIDLLHSRVRIVDGDGNLIEYSQNCPEFESCFDFIWHRIMGYRLQFVPEFMYKTSALRNIKGFVDFPLAWCSDDATSFRLSYPAGICFTASTCFNWRKSHLNISHSGNLEKKILAISEFKIWFDQFLHEASQSNMYEEDLLELINRAKEFRFWSLEIAAFELFLKSNGFIRTLIKIIELRNKTLVRKRTLIIKIIRSYSGGILH